ncbi:guanylate kinase [Penicillium atrosanguineum]|nr:guanylate kinase [Penicillium atrosanguineum]
MSPTTEVRPQDGRPIVISGPSGVGKGTLIQKLFDEHPDTFTFAVSHTTRKPRVSEIEGKNYFFVSSSEEFFSLVTQGAFVEHATFSGNHYGTSKETIADQMGKGLVVVLDIEMNGVKQMKVNSSVDARYIFIKPPPSFGALEARLRMRGTEENEEVKQRLAQAEAELEYAETPGVYDKIIVNDDLEQAFNELKEFIYQPADHKSGSQ